MIMIMGLKMTLKIQTVITINMMMKVLPRQWLIKCKNNNNINTVYEQIFCH